jgi:hypothetical protein
MADIPCANRIICPGPAQTLDGDDPITNYSSEQVDGVDFTVMSWPIADPTDPFNPTDPTNPPVDCTSPTSVEDAELCAIAIPPSDPTLMGIGDRGSIFHSSAQSCAYTCPDGTAFLWRVPPGAFVDFSQSAADQRAAAFACKQVLQNAVCFSVQSTSACLGAFFLSVISASGGFTPYAIKLVAGTLPPGIGFVQDTPGTAFFSGVPTTPGVYPVAIAVNDSHGNIVTRTITISVLAITNASTMPLPSVGSFYNTQLIGAGGVAPYTFSGGAGLPGGLVLQSNGFVVGNPVAPIGTGFTATIRDALGNSCDFAVTYLAANCDFFNGLVWLAPSIQLPIHNPPNSGNATVTHPGPNSVLINGACFINGVGDFQTAINQDALVNTNGFTGNCKITVNANMSSFWGYRVFIMDPTFSVSYYDIPFAIHAGGILSTSFTFPVPAIPQIGVSILLIYGNNNVVVIATGSLQLDFGS